MTFPAISASLLAADWACLGDEIRAMDAAGTDTFHWDIMDGHFVPNLTFGPDHLRACRSATDKTFDVHLMTTNPENWIDAFAAAGANAINIHREVKSFSPDLLAHIQSKGVKAGMAINPETDLDLNAAILKHLDQILIMTVKPGFGGQTFLDMTAKIKQARHDHPDLKIIIDGGINDQTAQSVIDAGATTLISGSYLFKDKNNYKNAIASLRGGAR